MSEHSINGMLNVTLQRIRELVDTNTIIGEAITTEDGTMILPVSRITYGFVSGGTDMGPKTAKDMFGGAAGAGATVSPVAFLVISNGKVRLIQLADKNNSVDRIIGMMPDVVDKIQEIVSDIPQNKEKKTKTKKAKTEETAKPEE